MSKAMKVATSSPDALVTMPPPASSESGALLQMIERAARDPAVDIDKMERLFTMRERMVAQQAKAAYLAALADLQAEMPTIEKLGKIGMNEKGADGQKTGRQVAMAKYAKWEDVVDGITPWLFKHGFSLSFRIAQPMPDRMTTTAVLGHRAGHSEETSISLPMDTSGGKGNMHGWGSSSSYGKRYTGFALLNIVARGEDDDGAAAEAAAMITEEQIKNIKEQVEKYEANTGKLCDFMNVEDLQSIPAAQYEAALAYLDAKRRFGGKK